jgi:hypothetical protein
MLIYVDPDLEFLPDDEPDKRSSKNFMFKIKALFSCISVVNIVVPGEKGK